ncbi:MAG: CARDB domain-containing protein [Myxococcota bacterium]
MDLTPWKSPAGANQAGLTPGTVPDLDVATAPRFGEPLAVTATVFNRGATITQVPNSEGGQTRLTVVRLDTTAVVPQDALIVAPAPAAPQTVAYAMTPDAALCDVDNPVQSLRVHVDDNGTYQEQSEANNATTRPFPDLVVSDIQLINATCVGDVLFTVQNAAGPLPMGVGSYMARLEVTDPLGATTVYPPAGPFIGTGTFLIQAAIPTAAHGDYTLKVTADVGATTACGDIPEQNEKNNQRTEVHTLCPDPSPQVVGIDITASGPAKYGVPVTITARVHNYGNNTLSTPVDVFLTSDLGPVLETDADLSGDVRTVVNSCADPINPGQEKLVSWIWTPRHADQVRLLRVIVDPDLPDGHAPGREFAGLECNAANNEAVRPLWLDLSPWDDYRGANYGTLVDLDVDGPPEFEQLLTVTGAVHSRPPIPAPVEPPIQVIVNMEPGSLVQHTARRLSGAEDLLLPTQIEMPSWGAPQVYDTPWAVVTPQCNTADPIQTIRAFVDVADVHLENIETNNVTERQLPDLVTTSITRTAIVQSRADLFFATGNQGDHTKMAVGTHVAEGDLELPSGAVLPFATVGPFVGTGTHSLATAVLFRENGTYRVKVTSDPAQLSNACGDLPERDELNNTRVQPFAVCPDVTPALAFGGALKYEVPVPVHVTITNLGNNTLVEDVEVTLSATRAADGLPATLDLDQNGKIAPFSLGAGLDPGQSTQVSFTWTPRQSEQVSSVRATLAVLDTDPANGDVAARECDYDNNDAALPVGLDVSPWRDARGENTIYGSNPPTTQAIDIAVDSAPVNGVPLVTTSRIANRGNITPDDVTVDLYELRGGWTFRADLVAQVPPKVMPPAGGSVDTPMGWTPQTYRLDPHPDGPLWGIQTVVDDPDLLFESREDNNTTRRLLVDLVPTDISVPFNPCLGYATPAVGFPTTITARVAKPLPPPGFAIPEMPLSPYHLSLYIDGAYHSTIGPLSAPGTFTMATGVVFATEGNHDLEIRVDEAPDLARDNRVPERDEDNNHRLETIFVHAPRPDLSTWASPGAASASDLSIVSGDIGAPVTVSANVYNRGEVDSGPVAVRLLIDGITRDAALVGPVPVGGSVPVSLQWPAGTAGNHTATVLVDPASEVLECREDNNGSARSFEIPAPEICVSAVDFLAKNGVSAPSPPRRSATRSPCAAASPTSPAPAPPPRSPAPSASTRAPRSSCSAASLPPRSPPDRPSSPASSPTSRCPAPGRAARRPLPLDRDRPVPVRPRLHLAGHRQHPGQHHPRLRHAGPPPRRRNAA